MGAPKANLQFRGEPLLPSVVAALGRAAAPVLVVLDAIQVLKYAIPDDVVIVRDRTQDAGPVAGLVAGLNACSSELVVAVGCDMPFLDPLLLRWLVAQAEGADAVIPVVDERPQYLHAIYRVSARGAIDRLLAGGARSLRAIAAGLETRYVTPPAGSNRSFTNVNTPAELRRAEQLERAELADPTL
jgi:molybdopterin-guanine dinucleotide biosynthesis protein A